MDNYANQLPDQYGTDVASEAITRSRSNLGLNLDVMPSVPYSSGSTIVSLGSKLSKIVSGLEYAI
ncbi:hypothetical protein EWM64_g10265 [Hericium alpestre]|uniref:Uncharacterized protein n=1 Tax=Hericium alpestre TaxID=135208 RepID=A0A4Y9ZJY9_9AGAM|nr:hypothetical protein EWM64_g10265 [Hericium alpestre]